MAEEREIDIMEMFGPNMVRGLEDVWRAHKEMSESVAQAYKPFSLFMEQQAEMHRRVAEALAPMTRAAEEIARATQPLIDDWVRMQEMLQSISLPVLPTPSSIFAPYRVEEPIEYIPRPTGPKIVRLDEYSMNTIVEKVVVLFKTEASQIPIAPISIVPMPVGATWDDTELRLADIHTLRVFHKRKLIGPYDYAALNFDRKNTKDRTPDKQWGLLVQIAVIVETKKFKPTIESLSRHLGITRGACEKLKENLSKKLKDAFGISSDPFLKYDPVEGYRPKFTLKPEALLRGKGELRSSGKEFHEDSYKEEDDSQDFLD